MINRYEEKYRFLGTNKQHFISQNLDISITHITKADCGLLGRAVEDKFPLIVLRCEGGGYFVFTGLKISTEELINGYGFSRQFVLILSNAEEDGYKYVQFEYDGIIYEDLEIFGDGR
jgi:hypothetical protein